MDTWWQDAMKEQTRWLKYLSDPGLFKIMMDSAMQRTNHYPADKDLRSIMHSSFSEVGNYSWASKNGF